MLERESGNEKRANSEIPNQVRSYLYTYIYITTITAASEVFQQQAPHLYILQVEWSTYIIWYTLSFVARNTYYCHSCTILGL